MQKVHKPTPKLTDDQRHARFKEMAREVEASEEAQDFDEAFATVTHPGKQGEPRKAS